MDMDEMVFYSLDELAIKQEIAYKKENLPTADVLFSWVCTPKRLFFEELHVLLMIVVPPLLFILQMEEDDNFIYAFIFFVIFFLFGLYYRFTIFQPKTYSYELTKVGIRYTIEENVHENFYKFSRAGGKLAAFVSVIAVIFLGPLALAGAGAGLLHARAMSNHRKRTEYETHIMPNSFRVRYHRARQEVAINPRHEKEMMSIGIYSFGTREDIHISPDKLYQLLFYLKKEFDVIDIKEAKTHKELNREYLN
ncbi:TPA: hypothetical protein RQJ75_001275 [Vibrio vulnificus]|uniref:Uncharacterized protein n=1 Tax=Vibrio vulnificus (strain CMCP6) TaxID=216895 RepID=A0A3Q0L463_VIBVU|nr:hypothetical protein [Vibrio vulnificus]AAO10120.1 hypothetical protein VV1_1704 [Vibrio vulnificus CMCP6]EGR0089281.1 hypothetical protein [Vibrio vulnificus]EHY0956076.1 hypothetical protein [Vibrio vulnificus]EIO4075294.1 hypothetical protein [Vibrio vulnificus]ELX8649378.1 hypothetical protein [Vibrio vulnificus]